MLCADEYNSKSSDYNRVSEGLFLRILLAVLISLFSLFPNFSYAATSLELTPQSGSYVSGDTIPVQVLVNAEESINAVSGTLNFSPSLLEPISISKEGSVIDLWLQEPAVRGDSQIVFEGLITKSGFVGSSKVITIHFKVLQSGNTAVSFSAGLALADDGFGTNVLSDLGDSNFTLRAASENQVKTNITEATTPVPLPTFADSSPAGRLFAPLVVDYTRAPRSLAEFRIEGVTYPSAAVQVFIQQREGDPALYATVSDAGGNFIYEHNQSGTEQPLLAANVIASIVSVMQPQVYSFWLSAEKDGQTSEATRRFEVQAGGISIAELFSESANTLVALIILVILGAALVVSTLYAWNYIAKFKRRILSSRGKHHSRR